MVDYYGPWSAFSNFLKLSQTFSGAFYRDLLQGPSRDEGPSRDLLGTFEKLPELSDHSLKGPQGGAMGTPGNHPKQRAEVHV